MSSPAAEALPSGDTLRLIAAALVADAEPTWARVALTMTWDYEDSALSRVVVTHADGHTSSERTPRGVNPQLDELRQQQVATDHPAWQQTTVTVDVASGEFDFSFAYPD